ncbi:MAG: DUF4175 domain-containing protein [Bacteroidetes bacterium]|nr:DUF4175 domain-containing protein [Bacteroidota bacterium]
MTDNYNILIKKLDEFIKKYYKNKLIKGGIYCLAILLVFFITINFLEYLGNFGTIVRTVLFYSYLTANLLILIRLVFIPLFKLYKIGATISHKQAAEIIGKHFNDINDKLSNTLQLKEIGDSNPQNKELIEAGINQKIQLLKPFVFSGAIDLRKNRKYMKYAAIPLFVIVFLLIISPTLITEPTGRLIKYDKYFEKPAPFSFVIQNENLDAIQQSDFILKVKVIGQLAPENVYLKVDNSEFKLNRENAILFSYKFNKLQSNKKFQLFADEVKSQFYEIKVLPKPIILNFSVKLNYPNYIGKVPETLDNTGDLIVPAGTKIDWKFNTRDTKTLNLKYNEKSLSLEVNKSNTFVYSERFLQSQNYTISTSNEFIQNLDSLVYSINVIPDIYPEIIVDEYIDTISQSQFYFKGSIKDDYGFKKLHFIYEFVDKKNLKGDKTKAESIAIPLRNSSNQQQFYYFYDFSTLNIMPGDKIEYYFEIWDNDAVNGSKSSISKKKIFNVPSLTEIEENEKKANEQIKNDLKNTIHDAQELQKEIDELNKKLQEKNNISWQEKKQIESLLEKHNKLKENIENIKKQNEIKSLQEQQFNKPDESLIEKQKQLEKLFDEIMTDEMKELFKELEKMMEKLDKEKVGEMLEKMKMNSEDIEKELDRNLELLKQFEFEKKLQNTINKLNELAEKQDKLAEEEKNDKEKSQKNLEKQKELGKEFEKVKKDIDDLQKKNQDLENKHNLEDTEKEEQEIQDEMQKSEDELNQNKSGKASKSQKSASSKMAKLAEKLQKMADDMESDEMGEDIEALRDILENLVTISFDQEKLMKDFNSTSKNDPKYVDLISEQKKIKDDLKMVEDSLFALSKRQVSIESFVNKEINKINHNMEKALQQMLDINTIGPVQGNAKNQAIERQQFVMTSVNNLALLLSEALQQMQQQNAQQKSGNGKCKNPKPGGKPGSMKTMKQLQEQLNKQLEQLKKEMKEGKGPNGKKPSMSEQLARMAAQQEQIRKMMQQYSDELKKEGLDDKGKIANMMKEMEKTETDLVNKILTNETLNRQKEILTRLLESEKAERERELEEKRESKEVKNQNYSNPNDFFEYKKIKLREEELLKIAPLNLKPFYKNKVNEYFYNFEE